MWGKRGSAGHTFAGAGCVRVFMAVESVAVVMASRFGAAWLGHCVSGREIPELAAKEAAFWGGSSLFVAEAAAPLVGHSSGWHVWEPLMGL